MHLLQRRTFAVALLLMLASVSSIEAQKKQKEDTSIRSVMGTVFDPDDKPVNGAVVQLKDSKTLQVRSFLTKEDGAYIFSGLKVDVDYQVKAQHNQLSSQPRTVSVFDNRRTPILNLKLEKAQPEKK